MEFLVEVSARHIHLSDNAICKLFGDGYKLTPKKDLSQPGQFVCEERLEIVGNRGSIKNVAILGPSRSKVQVEISMTDSRKIGISTEIRDSGNISGTAGCKLIGPKGELKINEGVIIAQRHIHMLPSDAQRFSVQDGQIVSVKINSQLRKVIFGDVLIRVNPLYSLAMHIDTDEANAAGVVCPTYGRIVKDIVL